MTTVGIENVTSTVFPPILDTTQEPKEEDHTSWKVSQAFKCVGKVLVPENIDATYKNFKYYKSRCKVLTLVYKLGHSTVEFMAKRMKVIPMAARIVKQVIDAHPVIGKAVIAFKFASLPAIYFDARGMKNNGRAFYHGDEMTRVDAGLGLVTNFSSFGYSVASVVSAAAEFGLTAKSALVWAAPLGNFSMTLSCVALLIHARGIYASAAFLDDFSVTNLSTDAPLKKHFNVAGDELQQKVGDYIEATHDLDAVKAARQRKLKKHFNVAGDELQQKVGDYIEATHDLDAVKAAKQSERLEEVHRARIDANIWSRKIGLALSAASSTAIAILIFTTWVPLSYFIFLGCALLGLYRIAFDRQADREFQKALGFNTTPEFKCKAA